MNDKKRSAVVYVRLTPAEKAEFQARVLAAAGFSLGDVTDGEVARAVLLAWAREPGPRT